MAEIKWIQNLNEGRNKYSLLSQTPPVNSAVVIRAADRENKSKKMGVYNSQKMTYVV